MEAFFQDLFPPGFWKMMTMGGAILLLVLALDLLMGGKGVQFLGRTMNKKFHVDHVVVHALNELKKKSDREVDTEGSLTRAASRYLISGLLFVGGALMLIVLAPKLH